MSDTSKLYTISFTPNKSFGTLAPDQITFKGVSNIHITLQGNLCVVKQKGGFGSRKRRQLTRNERTKKKPNGQETEDEK